jgi:tripartite ATP-independent transporter DctM subunit
VNTERARLDATWGEVRPEGAAAVFGKIERGIATVVEWLTVALTVADMLVLLAGVIARYGFNRPLMWSDEVASMLFLWLAMLGSVVALHRGEHMRMTAVVKALPEGWRGFVEAIALGVMASFLCIMVPPLLQFAQDETVNILPATDVSSVYRVAALPVGAALMALLALVKLFQTSSLGKALLALALIGAVAGVGLLAQDAVQELSTAAQLLIFFVGIVGLLVCLGVPISACFGVATTAYLVLAADVDLSVIANRLNEGMSSLILLAVPLFIFLGLLLDSTGLARLMVGFLGNLLGHVRGGLSYVLVGAMYLVSGISGSKAADMAAICPVLFPEMIKRGSKPGDLIALLAATGAQTETVPPSIVLLTIGAVCGVSINALFTGGLLPSLVLGITLCLLVRWRYRKEDLTGVKRATRKEIWKSFLVAIPALALPFFIRFAVVGGIATATEVSTIGIVYCLGAGLYYGGLELPRLKKMLVETASLSGAIMFIIGCATAMSWALTQSGFSRDLAVMMTNLPGGAPTFMTVSILLFIVLGSVLEGIPAIVLFGPLLFPIAATMGIHEVHYAIVVILAMGVGLFCPPVGVGYYFATSIGKVDPDLGIRPLVGYMISLLLGLAVIAAVPWISIGFLK